MWYPHYLYIEDSILYKNETTGEFETTENGSVLYSVCREQVNSPGKVINGADGDSIVFSSVIHLPLGTRQIKEGTEITVYSDENKVFKRIEGKVLRFSADSQHCRIWV